MSEFPKSVVCLTEESVEFLYDIGREDLIVGVSSFVKRPERAKQKPTVSTFTHANFKKIIGASPDLVVGFSDIQKDIARNLIAEGLNVYISNHRTLQGTLDFLSLLGRMVDASELASEKIAEYQELWDKAKKRGRERTHRPKVYVEEWDDPQISGIQWFCEVVEACGGREIFGGKKAGSLAKERIVSASEVAERDPDIVLASWCGKSVDTTSFSQREGWQDVQAVKNHQCFELPSEIILQPGPALFKEAFRLVHDIFDRWEENIV